jgi:hypothetical protein
VKLETAATRLPFNLASQRYLRKCELARCGGTQEKKVSCLPAFAGDFFIQVVAALFADQNEDAGRQRYKIEQEDGRPKIQPEPQKAVDDQVNRKQKHANVFGDFHDVDFFDRCLGTQFKS